MVDALINGDIIDWAIERGKIKRELLANALQIRPETLASWIKGDIKPTFNRAEELANKLKIPFGYLYLSKRPKETQPIPDLRTIRPNRKTSEFSPDFRDVIYDAIRKQDWYREQVQYEDRQQVNFIGRFTKQIPYKDIAADIRNTLNINVYERPQTNSWEQFLKYLIEKTESKGVIVIRTGIVGSNNYRKLDSNEFLGFVISDSLAPLVFINSNYYKTAQIFTLAHELAHLWINQSGALNPDYRLLNQQNEVETFCDNVAAEVLVPCRDFELRWDNSQSVDLNIANLSIKYRVSSFVILRRAYSLGIINRDEFNTKYDELLRKITPPKNEDGGGGFSNILGRNSHIFTNALISSVSSGLTSPTEAATLLHIKIGSVNNLETYLLTKG